ncbi:hypothetical protein IK110_04380 [Candidatus Saccharibacteria bacterium]|nr:hypothetical protein [Candidatus Saccharibacteria bacterium]
MKKSILALLGALICTLGFSYSAHATSYNLAESCPEGELIVAQGENAEIILNGNATCRIINNGVATIKSAGAVDSGKSAPTITNNGTLTILSGNINKAAKHDSVAPIINNGTLIINGGNILADHGIQHNRGSLTMNGGIIRAWLHPAIWVNNAASVRVNGGTLQFPKDWVGIHTTGQVAICGGTFIGGSRSNLTEAEETKTCPASQSKLETPKSTAKQPDVKLTEVINDKTRKAEQASAQPAKTTTTTKAAATIAAKKEVVIITAQPRTTDHLTQPNAETPKKTEVEEKNDKTVEPKREEKSNEEEQSTDLSVAIAAILIVIAAASTGIIVTRRK